MDYDVITAGKAQQFYATQQVDENVDLSAFAITRQCSTGDGDLIGAAIRAINAHEGDWLESVRGRNASDGERNEFEALMAGPFYEAFRELPTEVLDDPDFWRYLGLGPLRWFTLVCDLEWDKDGVPVLPASSMETGTAAKLREHPVLRTFLRGQMCFNEGASAPYETASVVGATLKAAGRPFADRDVLKSHLIRVQLGGTPALARAFLMEVASGELDTTKTRIFIKYFRRARSTSALELLSDSEARALAAKLSQGFTASTTPNP